MPLDNQLLNRQPNHNVGQPFIRRFRSAAEDSIPRGSELYSSSCAATPSQLWVELRTCEVELGSRHGVKLHSGMIGFDPSTVDTLTG